MTSLRCSLLALALLAAGGVALAQTLPTVTQPLPARSLQTGSGAASVDLRSHFGLPDVTGTVMQVETTSGRFNIELFDDTPLTKANFLAYVNAGLYSNIVVHRVVPGFVVQTGGYRPILPLTENHITTFAPVRNEFRRSNVRGTLAMAKLEGNPDSATSEWFVNLANNNAANLDAQNGGFTVFAQVLGNGMGVVDTIAALPRAGDVPLRGLEPGQVTADARNLVLINSISPASIYPPATHAILTFTAESSNPAVATATINGSTLLLTGLTAGTTNINVVATDTNNRTANSAFTLTVTAGIAIVSPPVAQHVEPGADVTLSVTAQAPGALTYQWSKDGVPIAGATAASYTRANVSASDMGFYAVTISSGGNNVASDAVGLTVNVPGGSRLTNVSTRGRATADVPLTPGFVMTGSGTKNLVIRAVGPTLGDFGVAGALSDPKMDVMPLGQTNVVAANDNWTATPTLTAAITAVGAFALPLNSKDSAVLAPLNVTNGSGYTVSVTPAGTSAAGTVLAEVYDADGPTSSSRLVNVSTRGAVAADEGLTPGFYISGTSAKRVLIRAIGPTLANFGVEGSLTDPMLTVYPQNKDYAVATNNDWSASGAATLEAAFTAAGAFTLPAGSKDAAVIVRLPPGAYTAVATGVGGTTGAALVEVYDLDP